jgi:hypothetical protein
VGGGPGQSGFPRPGASSARPHVRASSAVTRWLGEADFRVCLWAEVCVWLGDTERRKPNRREQGGRAHGDTEYPYVGRPGCPGCPGSPRGPYTETGAAPRPKKNPDEERSERDRTDRTANSRCSCPCPPFVLSPRRPPSRIPPGSVRRPGYRPGCPGWSVSPLPCRAGSTALLRHVPRLRSARRPVSRPVSGGPATARQDGAPVPARRTAHRRPRTRSPAPRSSQGGT